MDDGRASTEITDRWLLDHIPGAVMAIDDTGLIVAASVRAAALVGAELDDFVGTSILEHVDPDAVWAYAAAMNAAIDSLYADTYGGPVRIAIQARDGSRIAADLWSSNQLGATGPQALVLLMTEETVALGIAEAVGAATLGTPYADVAATVAGALAGFPVIADAAVFESTTDGLQLVATSTPRALVDGTAGHEPWRAVFESGERALFPTVDAVPAGLADLVAAAGYRAVWVEPVALAGTAPTGALAVFRRIAGDPTPNELANVHHATSALALARLAAG